MLKTGRAKKSFWLHAFPQHTFSHILLPNWAGKNFWAWREKNYQGPPVFPSLFCPTKENTQILFYAMKTSLELDSANTFGCNP